MKSVAKYLFVAAVAFMLGHFMYSGSLIPLVHLEELTDPVAVTEVSGNQVTLADGRVAVVMGVTRIPDHPAVTDALSRGLEMTADGDAVALVRTRHSGGRDPYWYELRRVSLVDLCVVTEPAVLDPNWIRYGNAVRLVYGPSKARESKVIFKQLILSLGSRRTTMLSEFLNHDPNSVASQNITGIYVIGASPPPPAVPVEPDSSDQ